MSREGRKKGLRDRIRRMFRQNPYRKVSSAEKRFLARVDKRVKIGFAFLMVILAVLMVKFSYEATRNTRANLISALDQFNYSATTTVAMPGDILDANMTRIASSYSVYILILDPKVLKDSEDIHPGTIERTVDALSVCFGLDAADVLEVIENNKTKSYIRYGRKKELPEEEWPEAGESWPREAKVIVDDTQREAFLKMQEEANKPRKKGSSDGEDAGQESRPGQIRGVTFEEEARRYYPFNTYASKLIGFRTEDTTEGLNGLEKYYDSVLAGTNGREYSFMNENADLERNVAEKQDGKSIVTTLDMTLTKLISDELEGWFGVKDESGALVNSAKSVSILAMDPRTNAVKAFVTSTDYDLNRKTDLSAVFSEEEIRRFEDNQSRYDIWLAEKAIREAQKESEPDSWNAREARLGDSILLEDEEVDPEDEWDFEKYPTTDHVLNATIWRDTMISDSYEPGSTGKVMTYAAAIEEKAISGREVYSCTGSTTVRGTSINCHNAPLGGCGDIDPITGLANSCNVAFIEIGKALGRDRFARYQKLFNLGQLTGIDLPGETSCAGLLYTAEGLNDVELATNAFGQCYNVTMLQLAAAFNSIINGGYYYKPFLVSEIRDRDQATVRKFDPVLVRRTVSEETSRAVRDGLEAVVEYETGTGGRVKYSETGELYHYSIIAKTGTAEKLPRKDKKYIVSVISAAPKDEPVLTIYVVIDEYGGEKQADSEPAQFLSQRIWANIMDYLGIFPDDTQTVDQYRYYADSANEAWDLGDSIMLGEDGDPDSGPVPPEDDGSGSDDTLTENPDKIINPNDLLLELPEP